MPAHFLRHFLSKILLTLYKYCLIHCRNKRRNPYIAASEFSKSTNPSSYESGSKKSMFLAYLTRYMNRPACIVPLAFFPNSINKLRGDRRAYYGRQYYVGSFTRTIKDTRGSSSAEPYMVKRDVKLLIRGLQQTHTTEI